MNTVQSKIDQDAELARLIKEQAVFVNSRVNEESEYTRRALWTGIYREVFSANSTKQHEKALNAANDALAAYDNKFGAK